MLFAMFLAFQPSKSVSCMLQQLSQPLAALGPNQTSHATALHNLCHGTVHTYGCGLGGE